MEQVQIPVAEKGRRVDHVLRTLLPRFSRTKIQGMISRGQITVDGKRIVPHRAVRGGETVTVLPEEPVFTAPVLLPEIAIVFCAPDYLIIEKPAGIPVHGGASVVGGTLVDALIQTHPEIVTVGEHGRPGIVHRLDKDVSGLLLVARTERGYDYFTRAFRLRKVEKIYLALVHGQTTKENGTIRHVIARSKKRPRMAARPPGQEGKEAVTHWAVRERYRHATLLTIWIETGRTHQIRAHLFAIGFPIVGDPLYKNGRGRISRALERPFLHASALSFTDPDGVERSFHSALPQQLEVFLRDLSRT